MDGVPVGLVVSWAGDESEVPSAYLVCDGAAKLRASFPELNALYLAAGYPWGSGDGATTFNVPDHRGRIAAMKDTAAPWSVLAETGGAKQHTHTTPGGTLDAGGIHNHGGVATAGGHDHGGSTGSAGVGTTGADGAHDHGGVTGPPSATFTVGIVGLLSTIPTVTHTHTITAVGTHTHSVPNHTHPITADPGHGHGLADAPAHVHTYAGGVSDAKDPAYFVFVKIVKAIP